MQHRCDTKAATVKPRNGSSVPRACKAYRAKTKGKVERPFRYIRQDFFLDRSFRNLDDLNAQSCKHPGKSDCLHPGFLQLWNLDWKQLEGSAASRSRRSRING